MDLSLLISRGLHRAWLIGAIGLLVFCRPATSIQADETDGPTFYRAINLNGPALIIDGHQWEADDAPGFFCDAAATFAKNAVTSRWFWPM